MNDVMTWTVFNLMTDAVILEQDKRMTEVKAIMLQLERKLEDIINA
jgi:hypothetical protein